MSNLQIGDWVTTNKFEDEPICCFTPKMREFVDRPGKITDASGDYFNVHGFWWPESALTSPDPEGVPAPLTAQTGSPRQYDLGEFAKAAMNGICASSPAWSGNMELGDFGSMAVRIARATIKALQEAEKEGGI